MRISPQAKDLVLTYLVDNNEVGALVEIKYDASIHGVTGDTLVAMIRQFEKLGLLRFDSRGSFTNSSVIFWINLDAHDLLNEGGFYGRYQLFQANVEKLLTEVDKLDAKDVKVGAELKTIRTNLKDFLDIISKVSTLAHNFGDSI